MIEAIVASSLTVYVLISLMVLALMVSTYKESLAAAFWATLIGLLALQFLSGVDPWGYVRANPKDIVFWAAAYFPIGVAWSFFRWWRLLKDKAAELVREKEEWKPSYCSKTWKEYVNKCMPKAENNKSSITCWITYWPFSAASYVLFDILRDIGNWIYNLISGLYQRLADHVTASLWDQE